MPAPAVTPLDKKDRLAWRELLGSPSRERYLFVLALATLQLLIIPFSEDANTGLLYLFLTLGAYFVMTRSLRAFAGVLFPVLIVYMLGTAFTPNGGAVAITFLAMVFGGALWGYLILHAATPRGLALLLLPCMTFVIAFLVTGDPMRGLLTLLPLPLGVVCAICALRCVRVTESVLWGAGAVVLTLAVAGALTLLATGGTLPGLVPFLTQELRESLMRVFLEARALYEQAGISLALSDVAISNTATVMVNLLPAVFLTLSSVIAFFAFRLLVQTVLVLDELRRVPRRLVEFTVSPMTAVLFLVAFLVSLFAGNDHSTLFGVAVQNFYLVLEPGLILIGFSSLFGPRAPRSCLSMFLLVGFVFILFNDPITGLTLAAFYGAIMTIVKRFFPSPVEKGGT